ncbi:STAS domain-containing protein [Streptomyces sp. CL12-4]|uniref:STAS domain-containing protein n=1 Tax=Streptomyces sp. CL12-4 TaxID=2810306 RepID=UPI001EFBE82C|nr:STAS domain-containing protein [Streptomyces sp. CL12-4]MCG8970337.1 STAS domain-containing protein [Streptomyces sp. CL12-4]
MVLDLSAVAFCDSSGLSVLQGAWRQAEGVGGVLVLACVPPKPRRMLRVTGMDIALQVYGTVAEAEDELVVGGGA